MTPSAFIAYPVTGTRHVGDIAAVAQGLRTALTACGWTVLPEVVVEEPVAIARFRDGEGRRLAERNVEQVASATVLVILADGAAETSSVWIEAGVALARGVPTVVVASIGTTLPFLLGSALDSDAGRLPPCRRVTADLRLPETVHRVAQQIVSLTPPAKEPT
ncbi:hypothetical protein ACTMSW_19120 [Micromonospora sp. BQ11]|uniref:hypothetical protein n=1 Tax=Micromonospora sp. BQ11 TaxID=3452212 RepID=UPI003F8B07C2